MSIEKPILNAVEHELQRRKEFLEKKLSDFRWASVGEPDFEKTANEVLAQDHEAAVNELNIDWAEAMTNPDDLEGIASYLDAACARGLIPEEFLPEVKKTEFFAMRDPAKLQTPEGVRYFLSNASEVEEAAEMDWDMATTIVFRAKEMERAAGAANEAVKRMRGIVATSVNPSRNRYVIAGPDVLDARNQDLQARAGRFGYAQSIRNLLGNYASNLVDQYPGRRYQDSDLPFELYKQYSRDSLSQTMDQWQQLEAVPAYREIKQTLSDFLRNQEDRYLLGLATECIEFTAYQYLRRVLNVDATQTCLNLEALEGKTFADLENPFEPLIATTTLGIPWVGCTEQRHHFIVPSMRIVPPKKKRLEE